MTKQQARGTFEVKLTPQPGEDVPARMSIEKQFHGDLEAVSSGQMLAAGTSVKGSAAYVAIERVSGSLDGHSGTFLLQHTGIMTRGSGELTITVVPDSGSGDLAGLAGAMTVQIAGGNHSYEFDQLHPGPHLPDAHPEISRVDIRPEQRHTKVGCRPGNLTTIAWP